MAELGSVFDDHDAGDAGGGPRGPDLRVSLEVPRVALGATLRAPVPQRLAAEGELVERVQVGDAEPGFLRLHLPESLPDRAMLRLRGQGGAAAEADGRAGDLLVVVELVDRPPRADETITRATVAAHEPSAVAVGELGGVDLTWWLLLGLALLGGGVLLVLFLL